jgi:YbbR domain-containing protein
MLHRNLPLKAASLLLAIFLWFWVMLNEKNPLTERVVQAAVTATDVAKGLAAQQTPSRVEIKVRGLQQDMISIDSAIKASVSCRGLGVGTYDLQVDVQAPRDVTVLSIRPAIVSITLEETRTALFPVELDQAGDPGDQVIGLSYSPHSASVSGAIGQVGRTAHVRALVDLAAIKAGASLEVSARAVDENGDDVAHVSVDPPKVTVTAGPRSIVVSKTVPVVVKTRGALPANLKLVAIQVDPSAVSFTAVADHVEPIGMIDTEELQLSAIHGSTTQTLRLIVPEGLQLVGDGKARVLVTVARTPSPGVGSGPPGY